MTFADVCHYFELLQQTSSRRSLIAILSRLLKESSAEEIDTVIYLTQGRIAPLYAPLEIGMADKTVASALARAFTTERDAVLQLYAQLGDMGLLAQHLAAERPLPSTALSVPDVRAVLTQIAQASGTGAVERKVAALADLLQKLDALSAKHLLRIVVGKTRLGIGDPTLLEALARARAGDGRACKPLEKAYNETSDLGLVARTLVSGGLPAVERLSVSVGRPVRPELCERLPTPEAVFAKMGPQVHVTPKYDGIRVQIHKNGDAVALFSRNLEDLTPMFPEVVAGTRAQVHADTAILDAEALAYHAAAEEYLPFQETTKRRRKYHIAEMAAHLPLRAFVFDILYRNGTALLETPLLERMAILHDTIAADATLVPVAGRILASPRDLRLMFEEVISQGLEGVVVKRIASPYEADARNFNWVKLKRHAAGALHDTVDCVILGYIYGKGKRTALGAGALLVGVYDQDRDVFVTVTKIGTGLSDAEWQSIQTRTHGLERPHKPARVVSLIEPSVWVSPQIVVEVLGDEITRSPVHTAGKSDGEPGYALRFPRLVSFRDRDKRPEDATTVHELIEMYRQQTQT